MNIQNGLLIVLSILLILFYVFLPSILSHISFESVYDFITSNIKTYDLDIKKFKISSYRFHLILFDKNISIEDKSNIIIEQFSTLLQNTYNIPKKTNRKTIIINILILFDKCLEHIINNIENMTSDRTTKYKLKKIDTYWYYYIVSFELKKILINENFVSTNIKILDEKLRKLYNLLMNYITFEYPFHENIPKYANFDFIDDESFVFDVNGCERSPECLRIGDKILSGNLNSCTIETIKEIKKHKRSNILYSINNKYNLSSHTAMFTTNGWKMIKPLKLTSNNICYEFSELLIGDIILVYDNLTHTLCPVVVDEIKKKIARKLYVIRLQDNHSFILNNLIVGDNSKVSLFGNTSKILSEPFIDDEEETTSNTRTTFDIINEYITYDSLMKHKKTLMFIFNDTLMERLQENIMKNDISNDF